MQTHNYRIVTPNRTLIIEKATSKQQAKRRALGRHPSPALRQEAASWKIYEIPTLWERFIRAMVRIIDGPPTINKQDTM